MTSCVSSISYPDIVAKILKEPCHSSSSFFHQNTNSGVNGKNKLSNGTKIESEIPQEDGQSDNESKQQSIRVELDEWIATWSQDQLSALSIKKDSLSNASQEYVQFLVALVMSETNHYSIPVNVDDEEEDIKLGYDSIISNGNNRNSNGDKNQNGTTNTTTNGKHIKHMALWPPQEQSYIIPLWKHHMHETSSYRHLEAIILHFLKQENSSNSIQHPIKLQYIHHSSSLYPLQQMEIVNVIENHSYIIQGVDMKEYTNERKELTNVVYSSLGFKCQCITFNTKSLSPSSSDNNNNNSSSKLSSDNETAQEDIDDDDEDDELDFITPTAQRLKRKRKHSSIYTQTFPINISAHVLKRFVLPSIFELKHSVRYIKTAIQNEYGIPIAQQRLLAHGQELQNTTKMEDLLYAVDQVMDEGRVALRLEVTKNVSVCVRDVGFPKKHNSSSSQNELVETTYQMQSTSKLERMMNAHAKKRGVTNTKHIKFYILKTGQELSSTDTPQVLDLQPEDEICAEYVGNEDMTLQLEDHWTAIDRAKKSASEEEKEEEKDGDKNVVMKPEITIMDVKRSAKLSKLRNMYAQRHGIQAKSIQFYKRITSMKDIEDLDEIMVGPRRCLGRMNGAGDIAQSTSEQSAEDEEEELELTSSLKSITLRVKNRMGTETYFKIKINSRFHKLASAYAQREGVQKNQLVYYHNEMQLSFDKTISELGLQENDMLLVERVGNGSKTQQPPTKRTKGEKSIIVRVKNNTTDDEVHFKAKRTTSFQRIVTAYANGMGLRKDQVHFRKGDILIDDYSKDMTTLGIEDNDIVNAFYLA